MKIIAFNQLRNELQNGNLEYWFESVKWCDYIYIYDQNSTDGSLEYYKKYPNVVVIEDKENNFHKELLCKDKLWQKMISEHPDVDWVFSIDGDIVLDKRLSENNGALSREICERYSKTDVGYLALDHYNLWRSGHYFRIDNNFHYINANGLPVFWKNTGNLKWDLSEGLHKPQHPVNIEKPARIPFALIHSGFANDEAIMEKIERYFGSNPNEWPAKQHHKDYTLFRFIDESELWIGRLPKNIIPEFYDESSICPFDLQPLIEKYPNLNEKY